MTQTSRKPLFEALHLHGVIDASLIEQADTLSNDEMIALCHEIGDTMLERRDSPAASAAPKFQRLDQAMLAAIASLRSNPACAPYDEELQQLEYWASEAYARMQPALEKRQQQGLQRPVGEVVEGDVCLELVSLCCDILTLDGLSLANEVVDHYLEGCGDFEMMRLFDYAAVLFTLMRALNVVDHPEALKGYIEAIVYIYEFRVPYLLLGVGVTGSGKSRFTRSAMRELAGIRVRSSAERERLMRQREIEGLPALDKFSAEMTRLTYQRMARITGALLEACYPVYIDASCLTREQRELLSNEARYRGLALVMVQFKASDETLKARLEHRSQKRGQDPALVAELLAYQQRAFEPFEGEERTHLIQIDTDAPDANETLVNLIREHLRLN
ncbi:AAA family ATPase [Carnimonas nigrificans]|uniref:AAA family ATPase n=1 Tax=Carnimonas nigrificans TaxID=64323 RepID=UPI000471586A|nr:ATP-binding protein [Carnimonas nigrificans]